MLLTVFEVLSYTCKLDWVLTSSSFFKQLAMTQQINIPSGLPPSDLESLRAKTALKSPRKGLYQVLPTMQMAVKPQGLEPWIYLSQLKKTHLTPGPVQGLETCKSN